MFLGLQNDELNKSLFVDELTSLGYFVTVTEKWTELININEHCFDASANCTRKFLEVVLKSFLENCTHWIRP